MDKSLVASILFVLGSMIFTIDGIRVVATSGEDSGLYLVGSVVFLLGCFVRLSLEMSTKAQVQVKSLEVEPQVV
jgi:hypothetical protein